MINDMSIKKVGLNTADRAQYTDNNNLKKKPWDEIGAALNNFGAIMSGYINTGEISIFNKDGNGAQGAQVI